MIGFDEAIEHIRSVAKPLGTETVRIEAAAGRVLTGPVIARIDSPRSDTSSMDGYAVRESDLVGFPVSLRIVGESFAGKRWVGEVGAGECVRIFTGAPVPTGTDRIVIQENVRREDDVAVIDASPGPERHLRKHGSDFRAGDELLGTGRLLDPRALVAAAAADVAKLEMFRTPRLHILSTGDELAGPGAAADRADAVPDSVSLGVAALAEQWGGVCIGRQRLHDDLDAMFAAAKVAIDQADVVVVTGGASVGERDFAKAMFEPLGFDLTFSRVAIKPGKPAWLGRVGTRLIVGLPGNPTSALVTARLFLAPLLAGMRGQAIDAALQWQNVQLASQLGACGPRETFHRARRDGDAVEILPGQDSSAQRALADADLLVRQPPNSAAIDAGATVRALHF
jgi:molybdopterin molybdotransferase